MLGLNAMVTEHEIAEFLGSYLVSSPRVYASPIGWPVNWAGPRPTPEELAAEFVAVAGDQALELADWLRTPEGEVIEAGVALVIPEYYAADFRLFVDALRLVAAEQQRVGRRRAGALALLVTAMFFAFAFAD